MMYLIRDENLGSSNMLEKDKFKRIIGVDPETDFEVVTYIAEMVHVQLKILDHLSKSKFSPWRFKNGKYHIRTSLGFIKISLHFAEKKRMLCKS